MAYLFWFIFAAILVLPCQISCFFSLLFMLYFFIRVNLQEKILFTVFLGTVILGFFIRRIGFGGIVSGLILLSLLVYLVWSISKNIITINWKLLLISLGILILIFYVWYEMGPKTFSCGVKLSRIISTIFYGTFQFIFLLNLQNIRPPKVAPLFSFGVLFLTTSVLIFHYHIFGAYSGILRVLFFDSEAGFNYQVLAIYSGMAVVFIMEADDLKFTLKLPLLLCNFWIANISGGRQVMIVNCLSILGVYCLNVYQKKNIKHFVISVVVFLCILPFFSYIRIEEDDIWYHTVYADSMLSSFNRDDKTFDYMQEVWETSPFLGTGLGGYVDDDMKNDYGDTYPHNFFLEAFYEMGIFGLCVLLFPFFIFCKLYSIKNFAIMRSRSGFFLLPFFFIYFMRSMISDGLFFSVNIIIFVCVMLASYRTECTVQADTHLPKLGIG